MSIANYHLLKGAEKEEADRILGKVPVEEPKPEESKKEKK